MIDTIFTNIENRIINEVMFARQSIRIAVAWFNQRSILDILTLKVKGGISVELLLHYDDINTNSQNSLDFSEFKENGGILIWAHCKSSTMHEKFCVIDSEVVLHGTYNWTNRAEKKNDEHLCICKEEPNVAAKFTSRFYELKAKYSQEINNQKSKQKIDSKRNYQPKASRLKTFMEEMANCDLSKYSPEYLRSFRDYWTEDTSSTRMRFESKADFLMKIELDDWKDKKIQIEEENEFKQFQNKIKTEAISAYEEYSMSIKKAIASLDYKDVLELLKTDFEETSNLYRSLSVNEVLGEKKFKTSVYDYLIRCHAPAVVLASSNNPVGRKLYGTSISVDGGNFNSKCLPIIRRLEGYFQKDLVKTINIPIIDQLPTKENYISRYEDSCIYHSKFSSRLYHHKNRYLTKEKILFVLEAYYALKKYEESLIEIQRSYGSLCFEEIYKQLGKKCPQNMASVLVRNFVDGYYPSLEIEISIYFHSYSFNISLIGRDIKGSVPLWNDNLEQINYDLNWNIQRLNIGYVGFRNFNYMTPEDIYLAKDGYRFKTIEEACDFKENDIEYKPLQFYYDEMKNWPYNG